MRTVTKNMPFRTAIFQSDWFQYFGSLFLSCAAGTAYYAVQESKKNPEEESVRIVVGDDVLKKPLPAGVREMDLGISKDMTPVIRTKPQFEIWDLEGYKYYPKIGMFKFVNPQDESWSPFRKWW